MVTFHSNLLHVTVHHAVKFQAKNCNLQRVRMVTSSLRPGPIFCVLLRVSSDYARPITGQVTEVTCPVIGRAQPELTPSKGQKRALVQAYHGKITKFQGMCKNWLSMVTLTSNLLYSISQEICTRFCCALLCCGYEIVLNEFTWSIYPYSSGLLCWHWGNR